MYCNVLQYAAVYLATLLLLHYDAVEAIKCDIVLVKYLQDISDLFGADLPVEGVQGCQFSWCDGPLLLALKSGSWIVLDEVLLLTKKDR